MKDPKDLDMEFEANAKSYFDGCNNGLRCLPKPTDNPPPHENQTLGKVEIRYISDNGCYTSNGILYCICSKCRTRGYELPNDFKNFNHMMTAEESNNLQAILENTPERFFSYVAELTIKYYQSGYDTGVKESIKSIKKLLPYETD